MTPLEQVSRSLGLSLSRFWGKTVPLESTLDQDHCLPKMWVLLASISNCILGTEHVMTEAHCVKLRMEIGFSTSAAPLFLAVKLWKDSGEYKLAAGYLLCNSFMYKKKRRN